MPISDDSSGGSGFTFKIKNAKIKIQVQPLIYQSSQNGNEAKTLTGNPLVDATTGWDTDCNAPSECVGLHRQYIDVKVGNLSPQDIDENANPQKTSWTGLNLTKDDVNLIALKLHAWVQNEGCTGCTVTMTQEETNAWSSTLDFSDLPDGAQITQVDVEITQESWGGDDTNNASGNQTISMTELQITVYYTITSEKWNTDAAGIIRSIQFGSDETVDIENVRVYESDIKGQNAAGGFHDIGNQNGNIIIKNISIESNVEINTDGDKAGFCTNISTNTSDVQNVIINATMNDNYNNSSKGFILNAENQTTNEFVECYFNKDLLNFVDTGIYAIPISDIQMKDPNNFQNFDSNIWDIETDQYPFVIAICKKIINLFGFFNFF